MDWIWMPLGAVGVVGFLVATNWAKRRRLAGIQFALSEAQRMLVPSRSPAQVEFEAVATRLRHVDEAAAIAEERARSLSIPIPPAPAPNPDDTVSALASYLHSRAAQVTVAGGEQALGNLIDMSSAATLPHLFDAAQELYRAGFAQFALDLAHGGLSQVFSTVLKEGGKEFVLHGTQGVVSAAEQVTEHLHGAGHHVAEAFDPAAAGGAHFPFLTLLRSTAREGSLLMERKTTLERGLAHVAIDTAGTAVGGMGGAKAGAFLGSLIVPGLGTAVGGMVGAIAGAVAGRMAAGEVKLRPLKHAVADLQQGIGEAKMSITRSAGGMAMAVATSRERAQQAYAAKVKCAPRASDLHRSPALARLASTLAGRLVRCAESAEQSFEEELRRIRASVPAAAAWQRALGLDVRPDAEAAVQAVAEAGVARLTAQRRALASLADDGPLDALDALGRSPLTQSPGTDSAFGESLGNLERCAASMDACVARWAAETALQYNGAVAMVVQTGVVEGQRHHTEVQRWRKHLDERAIVVTRHRDALGLT